MKQRRTLRVAGAVAALAAAGAVATAGTVAAADVAKGVDATIKIKGNAHPRFVAPDTVIAGSDLGIVNRTNPQVIGPHTFSLIEKSELPRTRDEFKRCARIRGICKQIANDHGVFPPADFEVDEPDVENGSTGWDTTYDGEDSGDSWLTENEDELAHRQVTADPGNLWFLCIVHPDMQGKVKVLATR
jgi:plastocyanin